MKKFALAIHGGSGTLLKKNINSEKETAYKNALEEALEKGATVLENGGNALDAVEAAVNSLEDCNLFNAGKGSVFTANGDHEMDASIMQGESLKAGAVSLIRGIKNPISLARDVMEKSNHVFLAGEGAMQFAKQLNYEFADVSYFYDEFRYQQWQQIKGTDYVQLDHAEYKKAKRGTVGAVAMDFEGNLAAATSTGGMTNKKWGRIGDSPMIGAGTYASNKTCAVSCTGNGEYFIRSVAAYHVSCLMEMKNFSLEKAANKTIHEHVLQLGGDGGLIAVDANGNISMPFNTEGMYRACKTSKGRKEILIYKD
ncbi:MAG TPA: isoaspartyl peptidase/L-asparaginase [Flavobacteriaceae bacterium]|nr:isoaspartyl peptidase/L-asparaginase [Flavobacteriaceae bacterium]